LPTTLAGSGWIQLEQGGSTLLTDINVLFCHRGILDPRGVAFDPGWIRLDPAGTWWIHLTY